MKNSKEVKIRVYRAIHNRIACERFNDGHTNVLESYGIKKVTSANTSWFDDEDVFVIMVESLSGDEIYGGARLHLKNKNFSLPIEEAIGEIDPNIYKLIGKYKENKTGELCGLWNSRMMSGSGLSVLLTRVGVAKAGILIANKLELESVYILCAPWTVKMVSNTGFKVEEAIGNKGTFAYPTPSLIATLLVVKDLQTLEFAKLEERKNILDLRMNPKQRKLELSPKGPIEVEYDLIIPTVDIKTLEKESELK